MDEKKTEQKTDPKEMPLLHFIAEQGEVFPFALTTEEYANYEKLLKTEENLKK